jgi:CRP-like cAMP-binding protein
LNNIRELLSELPFLAGINPDFIDRLAEAAYEATFHPGQMIIKEGSFGKDLYLITEGHVQIFRQEAGQRIDLAIRGPGDLIGEMSLIDDSPRFATVFAREPVRAIVFPEDSITSLWMDHPEILFRILAVVNHRLREADLIKITDLQQKNQELKKAYQELQEAQLKMIEKDRKE